jgi:hypothetical protein
VSKPEDLDIRAPHGAGGLAQESNAAHPGLEEGHGAVGRQYPEDQAGGPVSRSHVRDVSWGQEVDQG